MEILKDWLKRQKEKPSHEQLCEEISSLIQEKVIGGNRVLVCTEPYRVLSVDENDYHKLWGDTPTITIGINKRKGHGWSNSLISLKKHSDQSWNAYEFREPTKDEHVNLTIAWLPIPEKQLIKRLSKLLKYIKGSTARKYY